MEPVKATLVIELNVECPKCEHTFDLVNDTDLNEEGWLLDQIIIDGASIDFRKRIKCHTHCPECSSEFEVDGVEW